MALSRGARSIAVWGAAAVLLLVPYLAYRAALDGYFLLDDFGLLAIVRFLDTPLAPFYTDHIGGSLFYRPFGMALWWLSDAIFGASARWHYATNLALHVAVAAALWRVVRAFGGGGVPGWAAALAFALHPVGIGTALWLSDRFDLLAALCGLLGLAAAADFARSHAMRHAVGCLLGLALALLSKEIGLAYLAAACTLCVLPPAPLSVRVRTLAGLALLALGALFLILRAWVLADPAASSLISTQPISDLAIRGIASWLRGGVDFVGQLPVLTGSAHRLAVAVWLALAVAVAGAAIGPWPRSRLRLLLLGAVLCAVPAALQWPLTGHSDPSIPAAADAVKLVVDARYYYTAMIGFTLLMVAALWPAGLRLRASGWLACVALVVLAGIWFDASRRLSGRYRQTTEQQRAITRAAVTAIDRLAVDADRCQIYLLDTGNWMFSWVADEAIKAVHPDLARVAGCLIQTEHTPWYHLVAHGTATPETVWPMLPVPATAMRRDVSPARLGRGEIVYLNLFPALDAATVRHAHFLSYRDGVFVDVTADVRDRRRPVGFLCNRPPLQCP